MKISYNFDDSTITNSRYLCDFDTFQYVLFENPRAYKSIKLNHSYKRDILINCSTPELEYIQGGFREDLYLEKIKELEGVGTYVVVPDFYKNSWDLITKVQEYINIRDTEQLKINLVAVVKGSDVVDIENCISGYLKVLNQETDVIALPETLPVSRFTLLKYLEGWRVLFLGLSSDTTEIKKHKEIWGALTSKPTNASIRGVVYTELEKVQEPYWYTRYFNGLYAQGDKQTKELWDFNFQALRCNTLKV